MGERREVIVQLPPKEPHQRVVAFLMSLMGLFIQLFQLGRLLPAPFEMRTPDGPAREPDLIFVARASRPAQSGAPEWSCRPRRGGDFRRQRRRDRADKFYEYQAAGVKEY